jgi:hypothetical protein
MLTFFTTAKPFSGHEAIIQRNALESWRRLDPRVEVILFGDEPGAAEVCGELGLRHEPWVERHESGMKYLNYMFERAQKIARHDYLCYSNCDIVLMEDFLEAFRKIVAWRRSFLFVSQRWDTDVKEPIEFTSPAWQENLKRHAIGVGLLQTTLFIDYFVFPKGLYDDVPALVVGRSYWDWWLVWKALSRRAPVVDCTPFVVAVHQNHGYGYHPKGKQGTDEDALAQRNIELADNGRHLRMLEDATHRMNGHGVICRTPLRGLKFRIRRFLWRNLVQKTFPLRRRLGLRRESLRKALRGGNTR